MVICICFDKTEKEILETIQDGCDTLDKLRNKLNVTNGCGICTSEIKNLLAEGNIKND